MRSFFRYLEKQGHVVADPTASLDMPRIKRCLPRGLHWLRHACATHMLRNGADIRYIQELLGHRRLDTSRIYTHVCPVDLKAAHKKHHPRGGGIE